MKFNHASSKERRLKRQAEILWAIIGFLLVFSFSQVPVWVFAKNMVMEKEKAAGSKQVNDVSAEPIPSQTMHFVVKPDGKLWLQGRQVPSDEVGRILSLEKNPAVELTMLNRDVVALFYECARINIAPTVKLIANK